ncbi:hypothetical protein [Streptomyces mirabilis]|uniref:hypothetical protein n=1 Tax=Streptomyces mirabilis TaxID=68239 RepID=UPI003249B8C8
MCSRQSKVIDSFNTTLAALGPASADRLLQRDILSEQDAAVLFQAYWGPRSNGRKNNGYR